MSERPAKAPRPGKRDRQIRALNKAGWSDRAIARLYGVRHETIRNRRRRLGLPANKARHERHYVTFLENHDYLTPREVASRRLAAAGGWPERATPGVVRRLELLEAGPKTAHELAAALGYKSRNVWQILLWPVAMGWVVDTGERRPRGGRRSGGRVYDLAPRVKVRRRQHLESARGRTA